MGATKQIPRAQWQSYFAAFSRRYLPNDAPMGASPLSPTLGVAPEATSAHLEAIGYDPRGKTLEVRLEGVDHMVFYPAEIWVIEEEDGFISALEVVRPDGGREITRIARSGPPVPIYPEAAP
jgi:hypothetical protein